MKVAVYGAGGVGAYFGGRLAEAGADVHMIARGEHLEAMRDQNLAVESVHGDFTVDVSATDDPREVGPCDYVLFCVKSYDTEAAAGGLDPMIGDDTAVISLQNGVDNEEKLAAEVGREHVVGGVAYIFSTIASPGTIEHTGGPARIVFGELDGSETERGRTFLEWCERADGMEASLSGEIWAELWEKYAFICAQAGTTAAIRLPIGNIRETEESWTLFVDLLDEVVDVAAAEGVELPDDTTEAWIEFAKDLEPDAYSSLHHDMTRGNEMELEALHGTVVRKAERHGVEVPRSRTVYAILRPWDEKNSRG